jgi:hypothetical protein
MHVCCCNDCLKKAVHEQVVFSCLLFYAGPFFPQPFLFSSLSAVFSFLAVFQYLSELYSGFYFLTPYLRGPLRTWLPLWQMQILSYSLTFVYISSLSAVINHALYVFHSSYIDPCHFPSPSDISQVSFLWTYLLWQVQETDYGFKNSFEMMKSCR